MFFFENHVVLSDGRVRRHDPAESLSVGVQFLRSRMEIFVLTFGPLSIVGRSGNRLIHLQVVPLLLAMDDAENDRGHTEGGRDDSDDKSDVDIGAGSVAGPHHKCSSTKHIHVSFRISFPWPSGYSNKIMGQYPYSSWFF
jgi:hypothetical protein